jgi:hypothetical protein
MLRPSSLLALLTVRHLQLAPEDVLLPSLLSIRYLLDSRVCYPADWSIAGAGLSPARKAAAVGCTVVEINVREQRRNATALGRPLFHPYSLPVLQHAGVQPFLDEPHHAPVRNPVLEELHQPAVVDGIEGTFDTLPITTTISMVTRSG